MKEWMIPVKKPHTNQTFKGDHLTDAHGQKVRNLELTMTDHSLISVWECPSLWERIKFLFHGEITLEILGHKLPPFNLTMGDRITRHASNYGETFGEEDEAFGIL